MGFSFPRLYLASGVTTIRTAGGIQPSADLRLKNQIDKGWLAGPKMYVSGPYLVCVAFWLGSRVLCERP